MYECGYCGGEVCWEEVRGAYVHVSNGDRVPLAGPGDYVSDRHNRAGTTVMACDVLYPVTCGCGCSNPHCQV